MQKAATVWKSISCKSLSQARSQLAKNNLLQHALLRCNDPTVMSMNKLIVLLGCLARQ